MTSRSLNPQLACIDCDARYETTEVRYLCECQGLLALAWGQVAPASPATFEARLTGRKDVDRSGVWRFREVVLDVGEDAIVTHPEGSTRLYYRKSLADWVGVESYRLKHEGENPTGSFKDRGMTVAITQAKRLGKDVVACASTGNTSAALAAYAAQAGLKAVVFLPAGKVAVGKVAQAIGYGATCLAIRGDFDAAMTIVQEAASQLGVYMVNSLNPFRLEGQKTIMWEMLQDLGWQAPDWVVVPGGNLGNTSAFGKALSEAYQWGWIDKLPRIAVIQATGANPFWQSFTSGFRTRAQVKAETVATAIRIGNPVNYGKAVNVIRSLNGVVAQVTDEEIMVAKGLIDRAGIGCEPASACSLAGARKLVEQGVIKASDHVVGILTGHMLKDPDAVMSSAKSGLIEVDATLKAVTKYVMG